MRLALTEESWILDDLNPIEWLFLSQVPDLAAGLELPEDCLRRLKPNPLDQSGPEGTSERGLQKDWREFVEPDLDRLFTESRDQVKADLAIAEADAGGGMPERIEISNENSEHWYSVINQARLLMNEAHGVAEASDPFDPDRFSESESGTEQIFLLAQYEFYTAVQSILLEHRMKP